MANIVPPTSTAPEDQGLGLTDLTRYVVQASQKDDSWREVMENYDPTTIARILRRALKDIGEQEQARVHGLSAARDDDAVTDDLYQSMRRNLSHWRRSSAAARQKIRLRLDEVGPLAQSIVDEHQRDRRALFNLAKRVWLWEEGRPSRLDEALDDLTISEANEARKTLRQAIAEMALEREVTP